MTLHKLYKTLRSKKGPAFFTKTLQFSEIEKKAGPSLFTETLQISTVVTTNSIVVDRRPLPPPSLFIVALLNPLPKYIVAQKRIGLQGVFVKNPLQNESFFLTPLTNQKKT